VAECFAWIVMEVGGGAVVEAVVDVVVEAVVDVVVEAGGGAVNEDMWSCE